MWAAVAATHLKCHFCQPAYEYNKLRMSACRQRNPHKINNSLKKFIFHHIFTPTLRRNWHIIRMHSPAYPNKLQPTMSHWKRSIRVLSEQWAFSRAWQDPLGDRILQNPSRVLSLAPSPTECKASAKRGHVNLHSRATQGAPSYPCQCRPSRAWSHCLKWKTPNGQSCSAPL